MKFEPRAVDHSVNVTPRHPLADAATLALGIGGALLALTALLALFADALVSRISVETEMRWFGRLSPPTLVGAEDESPEARAAADLVARLTRHWDSAYTLRVLVSKDTTPNALAYPGGLIIITRGLIDRVETENELAFVIAHEIGHFRNRDHLRGLGRSAAIGLVIGTITSGGSGGFGFGVADLALRAFGREQESGADRFGLQLVHAEYGHVSGAWRFFELIEARYGGGSTLINYLETHPLPRDRVDELRQYANERGWPVEGETIPWQPRGNP